MIEIEELERLQAITKSPDFLKLSVHDQILYLKEQGIDFTKVSGWGIPTPSQKDALDKGPSHSIAEPKMDGSQPRPK